MVKEKKKCSKEGCEKNSYCRGLCTLHYQELRRTVSLEPLYEKCGDQCKADGCVLPVYSKGLCNKHWQRFHRRGTWEDENLAHDGHLTVKERLEKNQIITENGCIEWTKQRDKGGYGVISINNYPHRVPRVSYETYIGPITPGLLVLHKCDNRACFNPDHLFLGTYQDNTDDMVRKGRGCIGEDKKNSKLTDDLVREIKTRLSNGETVNGIFPDYPVSGKCLRNIKAGITWKHVTI
jgi:hypothetical protein